MDLQTVIFMGRSGCGKGTQLEILKKLITEKDGREIVTVQSGRKIREFFKENNYTSKIANDLNERGELQPEFISIWAWSNLLIEELKEDSHVLIDGVSRRILEAKVLDSTLEFYNRSKMHIIYLNVSRDWAIDKLQKRGRSDDLEMEDVLERMRWFEADVSPVLDHYRSHSQHVFHEINGEQSIDDVHTDIVKSLEL